MKGCTVVPRGTHRWNISQGTCIYKGAPPHNMGTSHVVKKREGPHVSCLRLRIAENTLGTSTRPVGTQAHVLGLAMCGARRRLLFPFHFQLLLFLNPPEFFPRVLLVFIEDIIEVKTKQVSLAIIFFLICHGLRLFRPVEICSRSIWSPMSSWFVRH